MAFAQLAEECRRVGSNDEAVGICRTGLARHPGYLSARVTLGRALIELGQLDEAKAELDIVVAGVPDNLAAIRGLAEIFQRRGQMTVALDFYRRALQLAKHDPDLEDTVERISQVVAPAPPPPAVPPLSIEELFDFDTLVDQLVQTAPVPHVPTVSEVSASAAEGRFGETSPKLADDSRASEGGPRGLELVELTTDDTDSLAIMERELRDLEVQRARDEQMARAALTKRRREAMLADLDTWLSAIVADRQRHSA
jgi:tetratricopeptide (TPR) repeat protein